MKERFNDWSSLSARSFLDRELVSGTGEETLARAVTAANSGAQTPSKNWAGWESAENCATEVYSSQLGPDQLHLGKKPDSNPVGMASTEPISGPRTTRARSRSCAPRRRRIWAFFEVAGVPIGASFGRANVVHQLVLEGSITKLGPAMLSFSAPSRLAPTRFDGFSIAEHLGR